MAKKMRSMFAIYRNLPREMYVLFAATIVNGAGIFVFPFLTLFLTGRLGMSAQAAGNFIFFTSIAYLPGAIVGGKLADAVGRKKVMLVAQLLASAMYVPCGFLILSGVPSAAYLIPALIILNVIFDGFADPCRLAMITDLTTPENRQAAFSLSYLGHNLGFAVGPLIGGFLFNSAPEWLFWGNALAAGAAILFIVTFVAETKPAESAIRESLATSSSIEKAHEGGFFSAALSRPFLWLFLFLTAFLGFVYAQHRFSLPLLAENVFGVNGASLYGGLMTLNAVTVILLTAPLISLLSRFKPVANEVLCGILYAIGFGMLYFLRSPVFLFVSGFVWTVGEIVDATNNQAYVANHTPMSHRGRFNAVIPFVGGFGWAVSTPVGGFLIERLGYRIPWLIHAGVALGAAASLLLLAHAERKTERTASDRNP